MTKPSSLRIVFAGTPDFASVALQSLLDQGHHIVAAYCQPDRVSGRGKKITIGPVKQLALDNDIAVEQPLNFKDPEAVAQLASYQPDLMVVVAYGLLLPPSVLKTPRLGCVNIHGSLLPRWRGAAPIQRAIEAGDEQTGITIMQMDEGLDTGPILLKKSIALPAAITGGELHDKMAILGGEAINEYLANPGQFNAIPQPEKGACYAAKLSKQEAEINWQDPASLIERRIRAFNPWPVAFTHIEGKRLRLWQAKLSGKTATGQPGQIINADKSGIEVICGDHQVLSMTECQPDNSRKMAVADLLNSKAEWFTAGKHFG